MSTPLVKIHCIGLPAPAMYRAFLGGPKKTTSPVELELLNVERHQGHCRIHVVVGSIHKTPCLSSASQACSKTFPSSVTGVDWVNEGFI